MHRNSSFRSISDVASVNCAIRADTCETNNLSITTTPNIQYSICHKMSLYSLVAWVPLLRSSLTVIQVILVAVDCAFALALVDSTEGVSWPKWPSSSMNIWFFMHIKECA